MKTTVAKVKSILSETELTDPVITSYIGAAGTWMDGLFSGESISAELEAELARWLAAHLIVATQERIATKEGAGGAFIEYAGKFDEGLRSTPYGQVAISLDPTGLLADIAGGFRIAKIRAVKS